MNHVVASHSWNRLTILTVFIPRNHWVLQGYQGSRNQRVEVAQEMEGSFEVGLWKRGENEKILKVLKFNLFSIQQSEGEGKYLNDRLIM